jgi:WD40 repeat protein
LAPDGKTLATAAVDDRGVPSLYLWETASGRKLHQWQADPQGFEVYALAFSPDGKRLASASVGEGPQRANAVRVWAVPTGERQLELPGEFYALRFSPCGKVLAAATTGSVFLWETDTGKEIRRLPGVGAWGPPEARRLCFSPDGTALAVSDTWTMTLLEVATGKDLRPPLVGHESVVQRVTFLGDGKTLAATSGDVVSFWEVHGGRFSGRFEGAWIPYDALSPDGQTLAVATPGESQRMELWDTATGEKLHELEAPLDSCQYALVFAPDGSTLAAVPVSERGRVRLWEVATGKQIRQLTLLPARAQSLAFSPDGKMLAVGDAGEDPSKAPAVRLLDVVTGRELRKPLRLPAAAPDPGRPPDSVGVSQISFSADGKVLAAATTGPGSYFTGDTIQVWEVETGQVLCRLERGCNCFSLSPDGKGLVTEGETARVWEVATGKLRGQVRGHSDWVGAVAFSPDGKLLATGSLDTTVLIWDVLNLNGGPPAAAHLPSKELAVLWSDLAGEDAAKAYRAIRALAAAPEPSIPFLRQHLRPLPAPEPKHLARLIADLDGDQFAVREQATRELEQLGRQAGPRLQQVLAGRPSAEVRRRLEGLLQRLERFILSPEELRGWRAVEVLERIGTVEAQGILERLVREGPDTSLLARDARASLERLRRRAAPP